VEPFSLIARLASPYSVFASVYDKTIGNDFFAELRELFERLIRRHRIRFSSAADLGCGTGLFARYLNSLWKIPVFGVDVSPFMLRQAAKNCRDADVILLQQDIRGFRLPRHVDLITANFDTLNHLVRDGDLPMLFRRVSHHLNPGGYFIFDLITPCGPPSGIRIYHQPLGDRFREVIQRIRWLPARNMLLSRVLFRGPAAIHSTEELHRERAYSPHEVARWLIDAGLVLREVLDAATLRSARFCTPRVVVVAQKPARRT
jgi:SAM-dependent methyltransferase